MGEVWFSRLAGAYIYYKYKKQLQKFEKQVGMEYQKALYETRTSYKGSKDGNKGQGSSLLLLSSVLVVYLTGA